jgi:hypothetical protein
LRGFGLLGCRVVVCTVTLFKLSAYSLCAGAVNVEDEVEKVHGFACFISALSCFVSFAKKSRLVLALS